MELARIQGLATAIIEALNAREKIEWSARTPRETTIRRIVDEHPGCKVLGLGCYGAAVRLPDGNVLKVVNAIDRTMIYIHACAKKLEKGYVLPFAPRVYHFEKCVQRIRPDGMVPKWGAFAIMEHVRLQGTHWYESEGGKQWYTALKAFLCGLDLMQLDGGLDDHDGNWGTTEDGRDVMFDPLGGEHDASVYNLDTRSSYNERSTWGRRSEPETAMAALRRADAKLQAQLAAPRNVARPAKAGLFVLLDQQERGADKLWRDLIGEQMRVRVKVPVVAMRHNLFNPAELAVFDDLKVCVDPAAENAFDKYNKLDAKVVWDFHKVYKAPKQAMWKRDKFAQIAQGRKQ